MKFREPLLQEERDRLRATLSEEARAYLDHSVKRGKLTQFARQLARSKGCQITDTMTYDDILQLTSDWVPVDYVDAGPNFRGKGLYCQCGRELRYQFTVQHRSTGDTVKFGREHLELHTGIPAHVIKDVLNGIDVIDYEQDELLRKLQGGWQRSDDLAFLPVALKIPREWEEPLELGLPLLDREIKALRRWLALHIGGETRLPPTGGIGASGPTALGSDRLFTIGRHSSPAGDERLTATDLGTAWWRTPQLSMIGSGETQWSPGCSVVADKSDGQMELFDSEAIARPKHASVRTEDVVGSLSERVMDLIREGIGSARAMCEILISQGSVSADRYMTGKPRIYVSVCQELDRWVSAGVLDWMECEQPIVDRRYRRVGV